MTKFEEKIEKLNGAYNSIKNGVVIIKKTFKEKTLETFILDLEKAHSNLHKVILAKLQQKIFESDEDK